MAKDRELTADDKFEMLVEALLARKADGITKDDLQAILEANSKGVQKALRPENETHPGKSVFSYPEGDVARPKGDLPFQFWHNGYPCHQFPETEHWREWELMKQVKPGIYSVVRKDGTMMSVEVKGEYDANQVLTKLSLEHPISREEKWLIPTKTVLLYQIVHAGEKTPRQLFVDAMQEYLMTFSDEVPA